MSFDQQQFLLNSIENFILREKKKSVVTAQNLQSIKPFDSETKPV